MYRYKQSYRGLSKIREDCRPATVEPLLERIKRWRFRDGGWQSVPWPDHSNGECCVPSGELESWLLDLELMLTKVVYSRRIEKLFQRQVQVTVEKRVGRDQR